MTDTVDRLLDYVQAVYTSVSEEKYNLFDKDVEENKKEYEKWVSSILAKIIIIKTTPTKIMHDSVFRKLISSLPP